MLGFTNGHFLKYFHCKNLVMVCLQMVLLKCFLNKQVSAFFFQEQFVNAVEEFQSCLDLQTKHLEADDRLIAETYPLIFQNSLNVQFTLVQYPIPPLCCAFIQAPDLFVYLFISDIYAGWPSSASS